MMKKAFVILFASLAVASCGFIGGKRVRGDGHIITESRSEKDFKGLKTYGSYDIELTNSDNYSVKIETDQNLLQYIHTSVEDGYLNVRTERHISLDATQAIKVYVSGPQFDEVSSSGSGNITGTNQLKSDAGMHLGISGSGDINLNIKAKDVNADISGSGSITLEGDAASLKGSIAGNGDIKAAKLSIENATIEIAGSGNASVNASKKLDVSIAGSGDVAYAGHPEVSQHVAGSGSVHKAE